MKSIFAIKNRLAMGFLAGFVMLFGMVGVAMAQTASSFDGLASDLKAQLTSVGTLGLGVAAVVLVLIAGYKLIKRFV